MGGTKAAAVPRRAAAVVMAATVRMVVWSWDLVGLVCDGGRIGAVGQRDAEGEPSARRQQQRLARKPIQTHPLRWWWGQPPRAHGRR